MKTKENLVTLGLTETQADEVMLLESEMMKRAVKFSFTKKDGSLREAIGTLCREKMVQEDGTLWEPKGEAKPDVPTLVKFWDCVAKGWRCFTVGSLIAVEG